MTDADRYDPGDWLSRHCRDGHCDDCCEDWCEHDCHSAPAVLQGEWGAAR
jgi:hypothetical protein